ncbi:MAG: energy transducer TonB [Acidobacteriia bacterium]|nr:energy transducer TonB [Terriglobia bacterium]
MSDFGSLSHCTVDGDGGARGRARLRRSRALLASIVLEAAAVAAMLVWPLVTPAVLSPQLAVTPLPSFQGLAKPHVARPEPNRDPGPRLISGRSYQPPRIPQYVDTTPDAAPPTIGEEPGISNEKRSLGWDVGERRESVANIVPPPPSVPRKISKGVMDALLIHRVQPEYPLAARVMRLSGTVNLRAIIGTDGAVRELQVLSGNALLVNAALAAVRQWRYQPTRLSSQPVEVETHITVTFVFE